MPGLCPQRNGIVCRRALGPVVAVVPGVHRATVGLSVVSQSPVAAKSCFCHSPHLWLLSATHVSSYKTLTTLVGLCKSGISTSENYQISVPTPRILKSIRVCSLMPLICWVALVLHTRALLISQVPPLPCTQNSGLN